MRINNLCSFLLGLNAHFFLLSERSQKHDFGHVQNTPRMNTWRVLLTFLSHDLLAICYSPGRCISTKQNSYRLCTAEKRWNVRILLVLFYCYTGRSWRWFYEQRISHSGNSVKSLSIHTGLYAIILQLIWTLKCIWGVHLTQLSYLHSNQQQIL